MHLQFDASTHPSDRNVVERLVGAKASPSALSRPRAEHHHVAADAPNVSTDHLILVKNAIKFSGETGTITISSWNQSPQSLTIRVIDTGIGIEPEMMERIFNRFEQGDRSFQRRFGGLGLGLTIAKSLVQAHGGTLVAESEGRNHGASFR